MVAAHTMVFGTTFALCIAAGALVTVQAFVTGAAIAIDDTYCDPDEDG